MQLLIHCCRLADIDTDLLQSYSDLLGDDERERYAALRIDSVRKTFLTSRALLRGVLATRLQCAPRDLLFRRDHNDKPQLDSAAMGAADLACQFNLSHSGDWVVLALADRGAVGVDVEHHGRRNNLDGISGRFFQPAENTALAALPKEDWHQRFFELWTLKESYVKALGRGIATALAGTEIEYLSAQHVALHLRDGARCEGSVQCWHYQLTGDYSLAASLIDAYPHADLQPRIYRTIPLRDSREDVSLQPLRTGGTV